MPRLPRSLYLVCVVLVVGVALTLLNVYELREMQKQHYEKDHRRSFLPTVEGDVAGDPKRSKVAWVEAKNADSGYLEHVFRVLKRVGYERGAKESAWDLLWHHDYPFLNDNLRPILLNLKPYQKVNHIPGSGYYTSKVNLATSNITGIPPAFSLPDEKSKFLEFARKHSEKYWVQKSNKHRGIRIKKVDQLDLSQENSFVQEYIANPLLVDGRKFDIGVYTMVTSVAPLRVYTYEGDALLRFCAEPYHPFDTQNTDKYVIGDDYTPMWQIEALQPYYLKAGLSFKQSFDAYLRTRAKDPDLIWARIRDTIRQVFLEKQPHILSLVDKYKYHWNFFELSRFDFVVDEDLNVYLMEANMSPNLSSGHFPQNKLIYEQVLYNLFSVVGVASRVYSAFLQEKSEDECWMQVSDRDLQVFPEYCLNASLCASCDPLKCKTCESCLTASTKRTLRKAALEHLNRHQTRRLLPQPFDSQQAATDETGFNRYVTGLRTEPEKLVASWFRGKCLQDSSWCS